jgi:hypothetical protein
MKRGGRRCCKKLGTLEDVAGVWYRPTILVWVRYSLSIGEEADEVLEFGYEAAGLYPSPSCSRLVIRNWGAASCAE